MNEIPGCLFSIEKHHERYFGHLHTNTDTKSLSLVSAFITGFQHGQQLSGSLQLEGFTEWVGSHYQVVTGPSNGFSLIFKKVGGDERLAFEEFFKILPIYMRDLNEIGPDGIFARYTKVIEDIQNTGSKGKSTN